ncbi:MarR family winged helix-turn-helix transcriptional regulator [Massilia sp. P8910]|uniref:MarR family winged helix-turn-helix transcriptional regulator n=1 Tax=Massilia antarctica TaxID=2765360 RepID=UPI0006BB8CDC|nr:MULTISPECIES: MarR family winged helix-turn-helix transcriptional regulator [Massilia]MCE3602887.1 MarR family winged helix-turn-helix transcriptional regulator [Massilia antarctica]MCY0915585.1 MarR family winged helix-turn-helix transcriptional regulator [Massilia sp. H27-R4]CUI04062.1 Transcriptional regulator, MarR family [Janthinobacterium sp. CG23_2]CUU27848.1 Transcriptional regulator, MarR family [Janthinobacterium sp. CG23_2]
MNELNSHAELCLRMARANAALLRRFDTSLGGHYGISFSDFQILNHLSRAPGDRLRRVDLAERLGLTASGITRSLLPLEKIGLVTREADPRDARVGFAMITASGKELALNASDVVDLISREALRAFAPDQLEAMSSILGQIAGINLSNS